MIYDARITKLQRKLRGKKIDAMLVTQPHNRRYLSGFSAFDHDISESSGVLLIPASGKCFLLTDFRYQLQAEQEAGHLQVSIYTRGLLALLKTLLPKISCTTLAFESDYLLHSTSEKMNSALQKEGISLVPTVGLIEKMRLIKDATEIAHIRRSVALNEEVFKEMYATISPSMTEMDVALAVEQTMRRRGAERPSFDTIVASGDNSALPHATPRRSAIVKDKPLTIDMGLILDGYCSDMTRTFVPGTADAKYKKTHRIVREAQLAGIQAVRAGVSCQEVDKAARRVISDAGYGDYFGHSLGHGVGLAVHEAPRVAQRNRKKLQAGMVITIEPGIYIPGWGGIRLEEMVLVTEDGCENFNSDTTWLDI